MFLSILAPFIILRICFKKASNSYFFRFRCPHPVLELTIGINYQRSSFAFCNLVLQLALEWLRHSCFALLLRT